MECEHDFVFNELHGIVVCRKCGHVLTAEEKRRTCDRGMELLKAEETEEYVSRKSVEDAVRDHWCDSSGTMEAIRSIPASDVETVVHGKRVKSKKHRWKTDDDGEIDFFAWDSGYCNGPKCVDCGEHFCVHCLVRDGGEEAVNKKLEEETCEEKTICSICGRVVPEDAPYCHCGARMDL